MKFRKADIKRLERMLKRMDEDEKDLQARLGKPWPGSMRPVARHEANSIRRVLEVIQHQSAGRQP